MTQFLLPRRELLIGAAVVTGIGSLGKAQASADARLIHSNRNTESVGQNCYRAMGVGGGGGMGGLAFSPHQDLWFVGTDMGTVFRSQSRGKKWEPVHNFQAAFRSDLKKATPIGFGSTPNIVFHAVAANIVLRSSNGGLSFQPIVVDPQQGEVLYWHPLINSSGVVFAATVNGLFRSLDEGITWQALQTLPGIPVGISIDRRNKTPLIYQATTKGIFVSSDTGKSFKSLWMSQISGFAAGFDQIGCRLAVLVDVPALAGDVGLRRMLHISEDCKTFKPRSQLVGDYVRMAETNSKTIYITGGLDWPNQIGTSVWVSEDGGLTFERRLLQYDWSQNPFQPWPQDKIEYSSVALDINWDDTGYTSFAVSQVDPDLAGGTGHYFLHLSENAGHNWRAPFTEYAEPTASGTAVIRKRGERWKSTGLEVTSIRYFRAHPNDPQFAIACGCDHHTLVTEDAGDTWRLKHALFNTTYDVAFEQADTTKAYGVMGALHDWGHTGNYLPELRTGYGGLFEYDRAGREWQRIETPGISLDLQCLSIHFNEQSKEFMVGTQGHGIATGSVSSGSWRWINNGLVGAAKIVPQIIQDPISKEVYALLSGSGYAQGDSLLFDNTQATGVYRFNRISDRWDLIRQSVEVPEGGEAYKDKLLAYPTSFALDRDPDSGRRSIFMTDIEVAGQWLCTGLWYAYEDEGIWRLLLQHRGAYHVALERRVVGQASVLRAYLSGNIDSLSVFGSSGSNYGALYSDTPLDRSSWKRNDAFPIQAHLWSTLPSPYAENEVIYTCFGAGFYRGPRPV